MEDSYIRAAICEPVDNLDALRILHVFHGPASFVDAQCAAGQIGHPVPAGVSDATHYIKASTGQPALRDTTLCTPSVTSVPANGTTILTLSGMRDKTKVGIDGPEGDAFTTTGDNASEDLTFTVPGAYTITAEAPFPDLPMEFTINAT